MADLTAPTINLNGSDANNLVRSYRDACSALRKALDALTQTCPHGRDYPDQSKLPTALVEHDRRVKRVCEVIAELGELIDAVREQQDARQAQKAGR